MKFISLDIETTGLDPEWCQTLEVGAYLVDTRNMEAKRPVFHTYVMHERITGHPRALQMNARIIEKLANHGMAESFESDRTLFNYIHPGSFWRLFHAWMCQHLDTDRPKTSIAGKNPSFDRSFLMQLPGWSHSRFHYRVLDPGILFTDIVQDECVPDTVECSARAGIEVVGHHEALDDALRVIELIMKGSRYGR